MSRELIQPAAPAEQRSSRRGSESRDARIELLVNAGQHAADIVVPHGRRRGFQATPALLQNLVLSPVQPILQVVKLLLAPVDEIHHAPKRAVLRQFG